MFTFESKSSVGWAEDALGGELLCSPQRLLEQGCCLQQSPSRAFLWLCSRLSTRINWLRTFVAVSLGEGMVYL